ncbi:hypothetical protein [Archangium sp.]|uniref:hypothetical protein n=1 Tax=Archangium sp. TaxID=1872627 RepID=UPI002D6DF36F|nr:hypothetical protein [Archangium sp.]HYO53211.1 hypothetical protein [Archangium sp.]
MDDEIPLDGEGRFIGDADYRAGLSEDLSTTLDLTTWEKGWDIERLISRIRSQVNSSESAEERIRAAVRNEIFPDLKRQAMIPEAGVYEASPERLKTVFEGLLFPGRVQAVNSIVAAHDSLSLGITQIGVAVIGYGGLSGTFSQRLFRKDMSARNHDALKVAQECVERRHVRGQRDILSELARRNIRAYAERAILVDRAEAEWRIGQGNPCSREMLSGSGYTRLLRASLDVLRRLIQEHKKFVFVPKALEERGYLTLGGALKAGEYAILHTLEEDSSHFVKRWQYHDGVGDEALAFVRECCPDVFIGLFRASEQAPPRLFYAHREHVHIAAHIALADSLLRPERGFPMLLDVADASCRGVFGSESFLGLVNDAYTRAGATFHYFGGR